MEEDREYRRVFAKVDLNAIQWNVSKVKEKVGKDVMVMAVIKADGYGHGALPIAHALNEIGVERYAVAFAEEGMMLRKGGIDNPILILGYSHESQFDTIINYDLTPAVFTLESACALSQAAKKVNKTVPIHIKLETGMNRIGFSPTEESLLAIEKIASLPGIYLEGIFTHMAKADEFDKTSAKKQMDTYQNFVNKLEERGVKIPVKHVANSASILDLDDFKLDMVRSGIITYGLYPSDEVETGEILLKPAMEWKTHIVHLKEIKKGEGVSYGHIYVADKDRIIATLPVGYADGYPRNLSNRGKVLIRGRFAPIVGRVCMDQMMVDVTDIPGVCLMDEVTLMGEDQGERISAEELGNLAYSFNYELVCGISKRVPRVIYKNGKEKEVIDYLTETLTQIS